MRNSAPIDSLKLLGFAALARAAALVALCVLAASCATEPSETRGTYKVGKPYKVRGEWYYPKVEPDYDETGVASWYGKKFHGLTTSNGERFDMNKLSAAHRTLPMPSILRVTNTHNGRSVLVRLNDRGPFADDRIIDVSRAAAARLGFLESGVADVRVQYVGPAPLIGDEAASGRFPVGAVEDVRLASAADGSAAAAVSDVVSPRPSAPSVPAGATGGAVDLPGPAAARARARERIRRAQLQQAQAAATPGAGEGAGQGAGQGASDASAAAAQANDAVDEEPTGAIPRRVAAAAPPTAETAPRGAPVADLLFVQVAAFTSSDNASALKNRLEPFGPSQVGLANVNGRRFYRVRVGPMTSRGEAEEVQARLSSAGYRDTVIVSQ